MFYKIYFIDWATCVLNQVYQLNLLATWSHQCLEFQKILANEVIIAGPIPGPAISIWLAQKGQLMNSWPRYLLLAR